VKEPCGKSRGFQMMLHQPRDVGVVFQYKNGLAQPVCPHPAAVQLQMRRPHGIINRVLHASKEIANAV
jgi:translation elongation factor EF-Ts